MSIFTGSAVAIVTPFKKDGSVDYDKFRDVIEYRQVSLQPYPMKSILTVFVSVQRLSTSVFRLLQEQVQIVQRQLFICLRKQKSMAWMVCLL